MVQSDHSKLAAVLVGGTPMAFKAYSDGSMVVIGPDGKKFRYTPPEVDSAKTKLMTSSQSRRTSSSSRAKKPAAGASASNRKDDGKKKPPSTNGKP